MVTTLNDIKSLVDQYCNLHLVAEQIEGTSWYLSRRYELVPSERDWLSTFEQALSDYEGKFDLEVHLPSSCRVDGRRHAPWGSGARCWVDTDERVFGLLRSRGSRIVIPRFQGRDQYVLFYLYSPPGTAEPVLKERQVKLKDLDFSVGVFGSSIETMLKESGNPEAFRWLRKNKWDQIDFDSFKIDELFDTPLLMPLLEGAERGSVATEEVISASLDLARERVRGSQADAAALILSRLQLSAQDRKDVLAELVGLGTLNAEHIRLLEDAMAPRLSRNRGRRQMKLKLPEWDTRSAQELLKLAEAGDVKGMESFVAGIQGGKLPPVLKGEGRIGTLSLTQAKLLRTCCVSQNIEMLDFLVSKGLKVNRPLSMRIDNETRKRICDVDSLSCESFIAMAVERGSWSDYENLRAFVLKLVSYGAKKVYLNDRDDIWRILEAFRGDIEVIQALYDAGADFIPRTSGGYRLDKERVEHYMAWLLAIAHGSDLYGQKQDVRIPRFLMNHGYRIGPGANLVNSILWETWVKHPELLAELVTHIPANSIEPANVLLPVVARAGSIEALKALEVWDGAYNEHTLKTAIDVAAEAESIECQAYLVERHSKLKDSIAPALVIDEDAGDSSPLELAKGMGAVSPDGVLFNAGLLISNDKVLILPEGIKTLDKRCFSGLGTLRKLVVPPSVDESSGKVLDNAFADELVIPASLSRHFARLARRPFGRVFVCEGERVVRAFFHPQPRNSGRFDVRSGDKQEVVYKAYRDTNSYKQYVGAIDQQFRDGVFKSFRNKSRIALSRLVDGAYLSSDSKEMYVTYVSRSKKKLLAYFEGCGDELFARITSQVMDEFGL